MSPFGVRVKRKALQSGSKSPSQLANWNLCCQRVEWVLADGIETRYIVGHKSLPGLATKFGLISLIESFGPDIIAWLGPARTRNNCLIHFARHTAIDWGSSTAEPHAARR